MTTTTDHAPLTREQLKALRRANSVSFQRSPTESLIRAAIRRLDHDTEILAEFNVPSKLRATSCSNLNVGTKTLEECGTCHVLLWTDCGESGLHWRTIVAFLKVGDALTLSWGGDYLTNNYMKDAGLHGDRLTLLVQRGDKKFGFIVEVSCCQHNTARMIRRGPYNNE